MKNPLGTFKIFDLSTKSLLGDVAITSSNNALSVVKIETENEGVLLHATGLKERYVFILEIPFKDNASEEPLYVGDILSNGKNDWVIKFDLMRGVYCTMIEMPDAYSRLEALLEFGLVRIGSIFSNTELLGGKELEVFL